MQGLLERLDNLGIVSIMDLDDYWSPGPHHPAHLLIKQSGMDKMIINNLRLAKNVTTTTEIFADEIRKFNENVFVLPNAIDPTEKQFIPNPESSERIRIGWLGGSSHLHDLKLISSVAGQFDNVQLVLCGFDLRGVMTMIDEKTGKQTQRPIKPQESVWFEYEKIFTDNYRTVSPEYKEFLFQFKNEEYPNVNNEPYRRVWTKSINSYASNYNLFDILIAPLEENIFNKVKSQLKVIEAGFHKKAIVAQDFGPYQIDLKNAQQFGGGWDPTGNSLLVNPNRNHKDWVKHLKKLVENPDLIKQLSDNLYNTVKDTYSINKVSENRRDLYLKLLNNESNTQTRPNAQPIVEIIQA